MVKPGSVIFPARNKIKYTRSKNMLIMNVIIPNIKIKTNGVFVNDVIADKEISKYPNKDIFEFPVNLFFRS